MAPGKKVDIERVELEDQKAVIFRLSGKLTDTKEAYAFLEDVRADLGAGHRLVVLNLEHIEHLSSNGIGIIAACFTSVKNAGGRLCVGPVSAPARRLLELVCLWDALECCDSEKEAVDAALGGETGED